MFKILCILCIISLLSVLYFGYQLFIKGKSAVPMFAAVTSFSILEIALIFCK